VDTASSAQTTPTPDTTTTQQAASTETTPPQASMTQTMDQTADPNAAPIAPQFQPNFKFKAFGKEHELDDFWRPLIKDGDSEKKVKDLFTRAYAFDDLKTRFDGTQQEFDQVYQEYSALDRDVRRVTNFLNRGDLENFFKAINLPEEKIYEWVEQKIQNQNLSPEQRKAIESQALERQRAYDLEMEKAELEDQYQTQAVQARTMQLEMVMSRPEVSQAASAWDSKMGQLGAFTSLVIEEAQKAWHLEKTDLSAEQAVQRALTKYGKLIEGGVQSSQATTAQMPPTPQSPSPQVTAKPVIPAVQGRGTSPVKKSPNSIEDLKQMAKDLGA
jgi:hypothetical protein